MVFRISSMFSIIPFIDFLRNLKYRALHLYSLIFKIFYITIELFPFFTFLSTSEENSLSISIVLSIISAVFSLGNGISVLLELT